MIFSNWKNNLFFLSNQFASVFSSPWKMKSDKSQSHSSNRFFRKMNFNRKTLSAQTLNIQKHPKRKILLNLTQTYLTKKIDKFSSFLTTLDWRNLSVNVLTDKVHFSIYYEDYSLIQLWAIICICKSYLVQNSKIK